VGRRAGILLLIAVFVTATAQARPSGPALRILKLAPPTVRGSGFQAGERVRVILSTARAGSVRAGTASPAGRFTVAFPVLIAIEPCHGTLVVSATGSLGSRAILRRPCRPGDPLPP
jgi:hypothetical protein